MITVAVVLANVVLARKKGLIASAVGFAIAVVSTFAAALLSSLLAMAFKNTVIEWCYDLELFADLTEELNAFLGVFEILASVVFAIVMYVPIYFMTIAVIKTFVKLVMKLKKVKPTEENEVNIAEDASFVQKNDKPLATVIGVLCGLVMTVAIFAPLTGTLRTMLDAIQIIEEFTGELGKDKSDSSDDYALSSSEVREYANDFSVVALNACGGKTIFDVTTMFTYAGEVTNISTEFKIARQMNLKSLKESFTDSTEFDAEVSASIRNVIDTADKSPLIKMLLTYFTHELSGKWLAGDAFMDINRPAITKNKIVKPFVDEMLTVLSKTTEKTVCRDLRTMLDLVQLLSDNSAALGGSYQDNIDVLVSGNLMKKLDNILELNSDMEGVADIADDMIMRVVAEEILDDVKFTEQMRDDLYEKIADVLTTTADVNSSIRSDLVYDEVNKALEAYGAYTSEDISEKISELLIADIGKSSTPVTMEDVREYFDSYVNEAP